MYNGYNYRERAGFFPGRVSVTRFMKEGTFLLSRRLYRLFENGLLPIFRRVCYNS